MKHSPCFECPARRPGCHAPETCPAWAAFTAERAAEKERAVSASLADEDFHAVRTRRAKWRRNKERET